MKVQEEAHGKTCRVVCTPWRSEKRHFDIRAVARVARYAVRDGSDPCELVEAVSKEVGCECGACREEASALQALVDDVLQKRKALDDALNDLRGDLGINAGANNDGDAWYRVLALKFRKLLAWAFILFDIAKIIDASEGLSESIAALLNAQQALLDCMRKEKKT